MRSSAFGVVRSWVSAPASMVPSWLLPPADRWSVRRDRSVATTCRRASLEASSASAKARCRQADTGDGVTRGHARAAHQQIDPCDRQGDRLGASWTWPGPCEPAIMIQPPLASRAAGDRRPARPGPRFQWTVDGQRSVETNRADRRSRPVDRERLKAGLAVQSKRAQRAGNRRTHSRPFRCRSGGFPAQRRCDLAASAATARWPRFLLALVSFRSIGQFAGEGGLHARAARDQAGQLSSLSCSAIRAGPSPSRPATGPARSTAAASRRRSRRSATSLRARRRVDIRRDRAAGAAHAQRGQRPLQLRQRETRVQAGAGRCVNLPFRSTPLIKRPANACRRRPRRTGSRRRRWAAGPSAGH